MYICILCIYIYIYIHIYIYTYLHTYIYIYIERERDVLAPFLLSWPLGADAQQTLAAATFIGIFRCPLFRGSLIISLYIMI